MILIGNANIFIVPVALSLRATKGAMLLPGFRLVIAVWTLFAGCGGMGNIAVLADTARFAGPQARTSRIIKKRGIVKTISFRAITTYILILSALNSRHTLTVTILTPSFSCLILITVP